MTDWFLLENVECGVTASVCFREIMATIQSEAVKSPIVPSQSNVIIYF